MSYFIWIPATILIYAFSGWVSIKNNTSTNLLWFWLLWVPVPFWAFVSRHSKNIVFDGILYDMIVCLTYALALVYFDNNIKLNFINYLGLVLAFIGLLLFKIH